MSDSGGSKYFNVVPMFILFREAIEASIVVSVLMTFCTRSAPMLKVQVWWGVAAGVVVSLILGAVFAILYYVFQNNAFQGKNQFIFGGVIAWVACIFITFLAFAMLRYKGWEEKWARKLNNKKVQQLAERATALHAQPSLEEGLESPTGSDSALKKNTDSNSPLKTSGSLAAEDPAIAPAPIPNTAFRRMKQSIIKFKNDVVEYTDTYAMFIVVFLTVMREGLESVVFLFGVGNTNPLAIPISGLVGIACGVALGVLLYYSGKTVKDIKWVLWLFAVVLFFIAAGAATIGAGKLMMGGMFGTYLFPTTAASTPVAAISSLLYGVEGKPPAPSAEDAAAGGFSDGDEVVGVVSLNLDDGYQYILTKSQPWFMAYMWDISGCCSEADDKNKFLALANAVFGYNSRPTFIEGVFYMGYWIFVLIAALWKWHNGTLTDADWKYNKMMRLQAEEEALAKAKGLDTSDSITNSSQVANTNPKISEDGKGDVQMAMGPMVHHHLNAATSSQTNVLFNQHAK